MPMKKGARRSTMTKTKTAKGKKVRFTFEAPDAHSVAVAGDFNGWDGSSTPLKKIRKNMWEKDVMLSPGRYEYKFVIDGNNWVNDPNNSCTAWNSFGSQNSVIEI
jgi:1,4-alpha-glucan branching enzyme